MTSILNYLKEYSEIITNTKILLVMATDGQIVESFSNSKLSNKTRKQISNYAKNVYTSLNDVTEQLTPQKSLERLFIESSDLYYEFDQINSKYFLLVVRKKSNKMTPTSYNALDNLIKSISSNLNSLN